MCSKRHLVVEQYVRRLLHPIEAINQLFTNLNTFRCQRFFVQEGAGVADDTIESNLRLIIYDRRGSSFLSSLKIYPQFSHVRLEAAVTLEDMYRRTARLS